ncbi:MAG: hypothetical protein R2708_27320 [Vicinamibacterales bacterium]
MPGLQPRQQADEVPAVDAGPIEQREAIAVGLHLEGARVAGIEQERRHRGHGVRGRRHDIAEHRRHQHAGRRRLQHVPQGVPFLHVADLVREHRHDLVVVLRFRHQCVEQHDRAARQREGVRPDCLAGPEQQRRTAGRLGKRRQLRKAAGQPLPAFVAQ